MIKYFLQWKYAHLVKYSDKSSQEMEKICIMTQINSFWNKIQWIHHNYLWFRQYHTNSSVHSVSIDNIVMVYFHYNDKTWLSSCLHWTMQPHTCVHLRADLEHVQHPEHPFLQLHFISSQHTSPASGRVVQTELVSTPILMEMAE